jgi:hypothetical protein
MPMQTIVTLLDRDGDEIPVALHGGGYTDIAALRCAVERITRLGEEDERITLCPPFTLKSVEDPSRDS